jgi:hypothetical protein
MNKKGTLQDKGFSMSAHLE